MDLLHTHCSLLAAACEQLEIIQNQINKLHFNIQARQGKARHYYQEIVKPIKLSVEVSSLL